MKKKINSGTILIVLILVSALSVINKLFSPRLRTGFANDLTVSDDTGSRSKQSSLINGNWTLQMHYGEKDLIKDSNDTRSGADNELSDHSDKKLYENSSGIIDYSRKSFLPWKKYEDCRMFDVNFATKGTFPPCFLASFPGSGNTWTRYLVETSTGIFTGSDYTDGALLAKGFYGENEPLQSGTTVAQKTHSYPVHDSPEKTQAKTILLIRNPYRAILAYHNYFYANHKLYAPIMSYRSKEWDIFVEIQIRKWFETFNNWIKYNPNLMVVHFEDLETDPIGQLRIIQDYLQIPVIEERLSCLKKYQTGKFKRKIQNLPSDLKIFSEEKRRKIDTAIEYLDFLLQARNLPRPPLERYEFYNGTESHKFSYLDCFTNETQFDCDDRIDRINIGTWKLFSDTLSLNENEIAKTRSEEKKDLEALIYGTVMKSLQSFTEDPVRAMIKTKIVFADPKFSDEDHKFSKFEELEKDFVKPSQFPPS